MKQFFAKVSACSHSVVFLCMAVLFSCGQQETSNQLYAGFGKGNITPDRPVPTIWTRIGKEPTTDHIIDSLYVRTTYFKLGTEQIALISCDNIGLMTDFAESVKEEIETLGIPKDRVTINCSHAHTTPQTFFYRGTELADARYMNLVKKQILYSVRRAMEHPEPAAIGYGTFRTDLNVNRIEVGRISVINSLDAPSGLVDNEVGLLRIDLISSGRSAIWVKFACHPQTIDSNPFVISADFAGRSCTVLESLPEIDFAQFLQGCGGNMNPKIRGGTGVSNQFTRIFTEEIRENFPQISTQEVSVLKMQSQRIKLPRQSVETESELNMQLKKLFMVQENLKYNDRIQNWADDVRQAIQSGKDYSEYEVSIQAMQIGDVRLVALPGEVFAELGLAIKEHIGGDMMVLGYSNHAEAGYLVPEALYARDMYETERAPKWYGLFPWAPQASTILVNETIALVQSLSE